MESLREVQFKNAEDVEQTYPAIARGKELLYLIRGQIEAMGYTEADIMRLVRIALTEHGNKMFEMPAKIGIHPIDDTFHHALPAFVPAVRASGKA